MPQAMRFVVPPTGNEAINLLKMTSLVTFIAVDDLLLFCAQSIYARTFETIPLLHRRGLLVSRRGQHHVVRPALPRTPLLRAQRASAQDSIP
jgi:hypothetical protein